MRNISILAGAAALAFTVPALAQPGKGGGNKGGGASAKVERGGGGGGQKVRGGGPQRMERGGGRQRFDRGGGEGRQKLRGSERREERAERRADRRQVRGERGKGRQLREARGAAQRVSRAETRRFAEQRGGRKADTSFADRASRLDAGRFRDDRRFQTFVSPGFRTTGLVNGCPPGLAAKGNGCLPPGQAKKLVGSAVPVALGAALLPPLYRNWYPDNEDYYHRTLDGYLYRVDRDRNYVDAYWPLADEWDGSYYVGAAYPQDYLGYYNVPVQYQPWYADNGDYYYRYGDGAIYQVDRDEGLIDGIVSLLAGGFGIGQPLPAGYDVYNVPYAYRDRYVDTADSWYRYNDGYIYEVDPTTRLVQAIVERLV